MPCFHPLKGFRGPLIGGKAGIVFSVSKSPTGAPMVVPCGQCVGCRLERSRQWAVRCVHEASLWDENVFITLTYNDENLPSDLSLDHRHFQLFMKRLRKFFGGSIRFYMCGEYGDQFGRPHFHALLFNCDFPDKKKWKVRHGKQTYTSKILEGLWPFGFHEIGDVTFQSAGYVARYVMKKVTGHFQDQHYEFVHPVTGEVFQRKPEYNCMSRRSGIGKGWFDKFHKTDVAPHDHVVVNGVPCKPPRYYDYHFEILSPKEAAAAKAARRAKARLRLDNSTPQRLAAREQCALARLSQLKRSLV